MVCKLIPLRIESTNLKLGLLSKDAVLAFLLFSGASEILLQNPHSVKLYFHPSCNISNKYKAYIKKMY
jgi:hypothetical protein